MAAHQALVAQPRGRRRGRDHRRDLRHDPWRSTTTTLELEIAPGVVVTVARGARSVAPSRSDDREPDDADDAADDDAATTESDAHGRRRLTVGAATSGSSSRSCVVVLVVAHAALGEHSRSSASTSRAASRSCSRPVGEVKPRLARRRRRHHPQPRRRPRRGRARDQPPGRQHRRRPARVKDRDKARRLVGQTAELRFRPVLARAAAASSATPSTTTTDRRHDHDGATADRRRRPRPPRRRRRRPRRPRSRRATRPGRALLDRHDPDHRPRRRQARRVRRPPGPREDGRRDASATPRARPRSPGKDVDGAKSRVPAQGEGYAVDLTLKDDGQTAVQRARRGVVPEAAAAERGRDRPRRRRAVGTRAFQRRSNFDAATSRSSRRASPQGEAERPRERSSTTARCRCSSKELTVENVSPTLGKRPARRRASRPGIIGLALVALYMLVYYRLLGARRDRSASLVSACAIVLRSIVVPRARRSA